jgi:uncharacterized protein
MEDMKDNAPPVDLGALDRYLNSDHAPANCMGLSDLDGFLTGIAIGPGLVPSSEWLPVIWGDEEPEFLCEAELRLVLGTIMSRFNEIATCFDSGHSQFEPIFWEGTDGEIIASDWAGGFLDAVALRPKAWQPLIKSRKAAIWLAPLLILGDSKHQAGRVGAIDEEKLSTEMPDVIPSCVMAIYEFWKNYRGRPKPVPGRLRRPKR